MHLPSQAGDGKVVLCMDRVNVLKGQTGKSFREEIKNL